MRVNALVTPLLVLDPAVGRRRVDPLRVTPLGTLACERVSYAAVDSRASGWEKEGNPPCMLPHWTHCVSPEETLI